MGMCFLYSIALFDGGYELRSSRMSQLNENGHVHQTCEFQVAPRMNVMNLHHKRTQHFQGFTNSSEPCFRLGSTTTLENWCNEFQECLVFSEGGIKCSIWWVAKLGPCRMWNEAHLLQALWNADTERRAHFSQSPPQGPFQSEENSGCGTDARLSDLEWFWLMIFHLFIVFWQMYSVSYPQIRYLLRMCSKTAFLQLMWLSTWGTPTIPHQHLLLYHHYNYTH